MGESERSKYYHVTLTDIRSLTPSVKHYTFEFDGSIPFHFKPGQYAQVQVPKGEGTINKPYSIASSPMLDGAIELCIKRVEGGYVSTYFDHLSGGESFTIRGPLGRFYLKEPVDSDILFLATGTGVVPFRSMLHGLFPLGGEQAGWVPYGKVGQRTISLLLGIRYEEEILYEAEFRQMAERYPQFHFIPIISRPKKWQGATGYVQDHLKGHLADPAGKEVYVCGLLPMIESCRTVLKGMGFERTQLHYEIYT